VDKFVYENSEFAIQHVEVKTDGVIAPDQLRRWSKVKLGDNLIALDFDGGEAESGTRFHHRFRFR